MSIIYDAGALVALEKSSRRMAEIHRLVIKRGRPAVPGPVYSQVWRGGPRSAPLARIMKDCELVIDIPAQVYRLAGTALGEVRLSGKKRPDVVDAIVGALASENEAAAIVTSDPDDIQAYVAALDIKQEILPV